MNMPSPYFNTKSRLLKSSCCCLYHKRTSLCKWEKNVDWINHLQNRNSKDFFIQLTTNLMFESQKKMTPATAGFEPGSQKQKSFSLSITPRTLHWFWETVIDIKSQPSTMHLLFRVLHTFALVCVGISIFLMWINT